MISLRVIALGCIILSTEVLELAADEHQNLTSYIFFGKEASDHVPYMVSIQIQHRTKGRRWKHICGGSIISPNYILTAAHCLVPNMKLNSIKQYRVAAGRNSQRSRNGSRHRIVSYTPHPEYKKEFCGYDIGVVKVYPRFKFNQRSIAKIKFKSSERITADIPVVFHGWGGTELGYSDLLHTSKLSTLSQEHCKSVFDFSNLSSTDLCAISKDESVPYLGDSGGPLVNENQTLQIGVCSYGSVPFYFNFPTVFTRISEFSDWIHSEISKK